MCHSHNFPIAQTGFLKKPVEVAVEPTVILLEISRKIDFMCSKLDYYTARID